jgi:hypothetical protein
VGGLVVGIDWSSFFFGGMTFAAIALGIFLTIIVRIANKGKKIGG